MVTMYSIMRNIKDKKYKEGRLIDPYFQSELYEAIRNNIDYKDELKNKDKAATVIFNQAWAEERSEGYQAVVNRAIELIAFIERLL